MTPSKYNLKSLLMTMSVCAFSNAQVAINNTNPQGVFHVDGAKDNSSTGSPTAAQQANDFIVKPNGNIGIGTATPQTKLDITTAPNSYGLQHTDGTIKLETYIGTGNTNGNTNAAWLGTYTTHPLDFMTNTYFRLRIAADGNVGIGTAAPSVKLEINSGTTNGAIKITDGTQGSGKVLMSDADGVGTWRTPSSIRTTAIGIYPSPSVSHVSDGNGTIKYTASYIDLTQGRWIVNAGLTIFHGNATGISRFWLHAYLSSSTTAVQQNGFSFTGPGGSSTAYAGIISRTPGATADNETLNFLNGSSVINVTAPTVRIYLLLQNRPVNYWRYETWALENYFYANPIN